MSTARILALTAIANLALIIGLALVTAIVKVRRERKQKARDVELGLLRPVLLRYLATWEDGNAADLGETLIKHHARTTSFEEVVAGLLPKLRGADRSVLVDILRRRGTVTEACEDTRSWRTIRRYQAVELLGSAGVLEAVPFVARLLDDQNAEIRLAAVRALGRIGGLDAAGALLEHLDREDARIPPHPVTMALLRIGTEATEPLLIALTADRVTVRTIAAEVLGVLGVMPAVGHLEHRLDTDLHAAVRVGAAHAVGRLGMPSSIPVLLQTLAREQNIDVLAAACTALGRITDPSTIPALERALHHPSPTVRIAAALALVLMGRAGLDRLWLIAQQDALGGDAAREVLARFTISTATPSPLPDQVVDLASPVPAHAD
jgi:HEAT repeat protein